jgi:PAS domain S-box-containing protein
MNKEYTRAVRNSISIKLTKTTLLIYFSVIIAISMVQVAAEYLIVKNNLLKELKVIEATFEPSIAKAMWDLSRNQLHTITDGMVKLPQIIGIVIEDNDGKRVISSGVVINDPGETILTYKNNKIVGSHEKRLLPHHFSITYVRAGQRTPLGKGIIYTSSAVVFERVQVGFFFIIINALIIAVTLWLSSYWIGRKLIIRPLSSLSESISRVNLGSSEYQKIDTDIKDQNELKLLEESFNNLLSRLYSAHKELSNNNVELEQKVHERTNELRKSEYLFRSAIEKSPIAMIVSMGADEKVVKLNSKFTELFGYNDADIPNVSAWWPLAYPDKAYRDKIRTDWTEAIERARAHQSEVEPLEVSVACKDGSTRHVSIQAASIGETNLVTFVDLTEMKRAETALRESEDFLNRTGDMAQVGGWEVDLDTMKVVWTRTTGRIHELPHGYFPDLEEAISYYHPEDQDHVRQCVQRAIESSEPFDFTVRLITAKGRERWVRALGQPIFDSGSCVRLSGTFQDITERLKLEEELRQSQKMESIGNLAGGIAHDFNNILSSIIGFTELALDETSKGTTLEDSLQEVYSAGKRAKDLVKQILAFARQSDEKRSPIQPGHGCKGSFKIHPFNHTHHDRNPAGNRERRPNHGQCNPGSSGIDEPLHKCSPCHGGSRWSIERES